MVSIEPQQARDWSNLSQEERDASYNNRAAIVDAEDLVATRKLASEEVRSRHHGHLGQRYGESEREYWDIFPGREPDAPCLAFIHGGYWQGGEPKEFAACLRGALEKGWSAALCGYPLAPEVSLTQIAECTSRALSWLDEHRTSYDVAGPIVLAGWSAGAQLAAMNAGHPMVSAVLCISGIFDLAPIRDTYLNAKLNLSDDEIACFSPMRSRAINKPYVIACGAEELPELKRQSRDFFRMRQKHGMPSRFIMIDDANHLTVLEQLLTAETTLIKSVEAALALGLDLK